MIISFFFSTLLIFMMISMFTGAPLVPSKKATVAAMIRLLKPKKGERVIDVGSGDGRLLIAAAKEGAQGFGIEINPYAVLWSLFNIWRAGQWGRIKIRWGNYWWQNLRDADAIVVYALPGFMEKMSVKMQKELKPGTRIVSNSFQIPHLKLLKEESVGKDRVFLYTV